VAVFGPTGSGKSHFLLRLAQNFAVLEGLAKKHKDKVTLIQGESAFAAVDTENKSLSKFIGQKNVIDLPFDVDEFDTFPPERFTRAVKDAGSQGYKIMVVDSWSHAWAGSGGALELVDQRSAAAASRGHAGGKQDKFNVGWREVTPLHNEMVETFVRFPGHIFVGMRAKMAYDNEGGQLRKLGMQPIQREGVEYEFDVVVDIDMNHNAHVNKSRCPALEGKTFKKTAWDDFVKPLWDWLQEGAPEPVETKPEPVEEVANAGKELEPGVDVPSMSNGVQTSAEKNIETAKEILDAKDVTKEEAEAKARVDHFRKLILAAATPKQLKEIATDIKKANFTEPWKNELLAEWKARDIALRG
jgi:hypothetical protein